MLLVEIHAALALRPFLCRLFPTVTEETQRHKRWSFSERCWLNPVGTLEDFMVLTLRLLLQPPHHLT